MLIDNTGYSGNNKQNEKVLLIFLRLMRMPGLIGWLSAEAVPSMGTSVSSLCWSDCSQEASSLEEFSLEESSLSLFSSSDSLLSFFSFGLYTLGGGYELR